MRKEVSVFSNLEFLRFQETHKAKFSGELASILGLKSNNALYSIDATQV